MKKLLIALSLILPLTSFAAFGPISVPAGGTGSTTLSGILKGNGISAIISAVAGTDYDLPVTASGGLTRTTNNIAPTSGFNIPLTASTTAWNNFLNTPGLVKLPTWVVAASGGDFTTIQGALDVCTSGGTIYLSDPSYTISSSLLFKGSGCALIGNHGQTTINFNGASVNPAIKTNSPSAKYEREVIRGITFTQTNATKQGVAIDGSDMAKNIYDDLDFSGLKSGFRFNDTQNVTFYNLLQNIRMDNMLTPGAIGIDASSTNPVNDNIFVNIRPIVDSTSTCILLNNAQGNQFYGQNCEPATPNGTIGVDLEQSDGHDTSGNQFYGLWSEGNGVGVKIASGVFGTSFHGGVLYNETAGAIDIDDQGSFTQLIGTIVNGSPTNQFAPFTGMDPTESGTFSFIDGTDFAHITNSLVSAELRNPTDTSDVMELINASDGTNPDTHIIGDTLALEDGTFATQLAITPHGHIIYSGDSPTVGSGATDCGTSPSIVGNDGSGRVTVGSSLNGGKCTLTFAHPLEWSTQPVCLTQNESILNLTRPVVTGTSTLAITGTLVAGNTLVYHCFDNR